MVPTRPLSFHPRELGAQNRQPPPPPSTSARRQPGPPDAALPREPPACPAPAQWAPGQLLAAPPGLRPHCLLGSSTNELTVQGWGGTASSTKPPVFSAACLLQPLGYVCHCGPPGVRAQCETSTPGLDRHWYLTVHDLKTPNLLEACWSQPPHCPVQVGTQFLMGARLPSPDAIAQASKRAGHELGPPRLPAAACPQDADPRQLCAASPGIALPCPVPRAPPGASWLGWGNTPILEVAPKASECTFCRGQPVVPLDRFAHPLARHGPRLDVKQPRGTLIRGSLPQNPQERLCNTHIS